MAIFDAGEGGGFGGSSPGTAARGFRKARFQRDWRWLKPQWLNMGGGLGEGGEIRKTGPADLIPGGAQIGPKSTKKVNILVCLLHFSLKNYDFLMCLCDFTLLFSKGALC